MKQKKSILYCLFACVIFSLCSHPLFAFGRGEPDVKNVEKMDSWREEFDLTEKKPGKYNIYARAVDSGQNIAIAGPYNIFIDPDSDKPVVGITNPVENMRVASNLNIVGTCVDDDAVQFVDIIIDGNEEQPRRAEGAEFWSYYLDTTDMQDGVHNITVYGTDIFGVAGDRKSVSFHLDRDTPVTNLQSHEMGTLVSGKVQLSGVVSDGNGIKTLGYSIDGGERFTDVKISYDKSQQLYTFDCSIDTLQMKDGPSVCWFKSVDKQGSVGIYTFLFFVDNTKPDVRIIFPTNPDKKEKPAEETADAEAVAVAAPPANPSFLFAAGDVPQSITNGVFHVTGYAGDVIGLQRLSWKFGKETGDFEIVLGNPWWEKEFDVRGLTDKSIPLEITAVDIAGNVTTCKQNIVIDRQADLPVVVITSPAPEEVCFDAVSVAGFVSDDDAPAMITYAIDGGSETSVPLTGAFTVPLGDIAAGHHTVTVTPVDMYDVKGAAVTVPFVYAGAAPSVAVTEVSVSAGAPVPFADGCELNSEQKNVITADLQSSAGLKTWSYSFAGVDEVSAPVSGTQKKVAISIPANIRYGRVPFMVTATDIHDRSVSFYSSLYMTNNAKTRVNIGDAVSAFKNSDEVTSLPSELTVEIPAEGKKAAYEITSSIALGSFKAADVAFTDGMELVLPGSGEKGADGLEVTIETTSSIAALSYSMDGGAPVKLSAKKANDSGTSFIAVIPFPASLSPNVHSFIVTADIKNGGKIGTSGIVSILRPVPDAGIDDDESFAWSSHRVRDDGSIFVGAENRVTGLYVPKTLCTLDSASFDKSPRGVSVNIENNTVIVSFDGNGTYTCGRLVMKDSAGGTFTTDSVTFTVDADVPVITWESPDDQLWIQNSVTVKGSCTDSSGITAAQYRIGKDSEWLAFTSKGGRGSSAFVFDNTIDVTSQPDGLVHIFIKAVDSCGKEMIVSRAFNKDTVKPRVYTSVPLEGSTVNGENTISFFILDDGIIKSASYGLFPGGKKQIEWKELTPGKYVTCRVGTADYPLSENMRFRFIDNSGNETIQDVWPFIIDPESDLPVVEIHLPAENEVMRRDFVVSGVLYDDDKVSKVWYKIDNGTYQALDGENSFALPVELHSLTDNEHSITMYAEDIFGLKGKEVVRNFRVSLEEPKAEIVSPSFEETCRKIITISGTASDKNTIKQVFVSLDNGISFNRAEGAEKWSYTFDSRVIQDGTHVVFVKVWDAYDTVALYSSLINTDNTAPEIAITLPVDTEKISSDLFLSGHVNDNIKLEKLFVTVRSLAPRPAAVPASIAHIELERALVINKIVDVSGLSDGPYNIEFTAQDAAGNTVCASRNIVLDKTPEEESVNILYPLNGEFVQGEFNLYGDFISKTVPEQMNLYVDGNLVISQPLAKTGYFNFKLTPELLQSGVHEMYVAAVMPGGNNVIKSTVRMLEYSAAGPWLTIDNFSMGDFAIERPWIEGRSGYALSEEDAVALNLKETPDEVIEAIEKKIPDVMEISFDNGKTFTLLDSARKWRYRLQTQDMAQGYHFIIFRATMKNGETAVTRSIARIDKTPPFIKLIAPAEGSIFNQNMLFTGLSSDDVYLESLELAVRPGDKSSYEIPGFIQGLYFDAHFWGATLYDVGVGLSFFDDNVKLQFQFGQFTQEQRNMFIENPIRYGGNVLGLKLIANIAALPFSYFLGPDWNWLSAALSIGANFSWFQQTQKGDGQILSACILQLEFPRVTFLKQKMFRTMSFYTEGQVWFIPTDIQGTETAQIDAWQPQISCGIRLNVF